MKWTRPCADRLRCATMISESDKTMSPQETSPMKHEMSVLGIDIAKRLFHAVGMDERGKIVWRKRLSRHGLIPFIAKLPPVLIGMEACGGAHDWARRFRGSCTSSVRVNTRGLPGDRHKSKKA